MKLACDVDTGITVAPDMMVGSDNERALHKALGMVFPKSSHLLCIQHLQKNVEHYLTDKIGQTSQMRRRTADDIFGRLAQADTDDKFDDISKSLLEEYRYSKSTLCPQK